MRLLLHSVLLRQGVTGRMPGNFDDSNGPLVENPPSDMAWYTLYFKSKEHDIFIAGDREDPFVLTIVREVERVNGVDYYQYRAIVFLETVRHVKMTCAASSNVLWVDRREMSK